MNLDEHLRDYCERLSPAFDAEPLNALSNLAFFFWAWKLWSEVHTHRPYLAARLRWLAGLIALVGLGSLAFHTVATRWAGILDVVFIAAFNVSYLIIFLRVVARWSRVRALTGAAAFVMLDRLAALSIPSDALNGSVMYLPAIVVLLALIACARRLAPEAARMMAGAMVVFAVSLTARTVDQALCSSWPWGTHFVWHVLNAWVLYRLSRALAVGARLSPANEA